MLPELSIIVIEPPPIIPDIVYRSENVCHIGAWTPVVPVVAVGPVGPGVKTPPRTKAARAAIAMTPATTSTNSVDLWVEGIPTVDKSTVL